MILFYSSVCVYTFFVAVNVFMKMFLPLNVIKNCCCRNEWEKRAETEEERENKT